ncbi:MAG: hypothetical protein M3Y65_19045 [Pseudomonadota bacterium]|nr:hypothetical protein [Pseudomonadota bacterium]
MKLNLIACVLVWSIILGLACYLFGAHVQSNTDTAAQADQKEKERKQLKRKNLKALASGVRTQQAQAATDSNFQELRANYETDQHENPGIGCVLDPISLRRWNEANDQSDGAATRKPDGAVPATAPREGGGERSE